MLSGFYYNFRVILNKIKLINLQIFATYAVPLYLFSGFIVIKVDRLIT